MAKSASAGRGGPLGAWPEGIFVGSGPAAGALAMLFPGQGSQYVGMLRDLACRFPMLHAALAEANSVALDDGCSLGDLIYPHPAFSDDERARHEAALRATAVAQHRPWERTQPGGPRHPRPLWRRACGGCRPQLR